LNLARPKESKQGRLQKKKQIPLTKGGETPIFLLEKKNPESLPIKSNVIGQYCRGYLKKKVALTNRNTGFNTGSKDERERKGQPRCHKLANNNTRLP